MPADPNEPVASHGGLIAEDLACPRCGYNLRGLARESGCPECGTPINRLLAPDGQIVEDVNCFHCGYNLRGLQVEGRCPECGTAVGRSIHGNLLRYADPDWLGRLLLGVRLALWTVALGVLAIIGGCVGGFVFAVLSIGGPRLITAVVLVYSVVVGAVSFASLYLITSQEPRISLTEDPVTLRRVLRGLAVFGLAAAMVGQTAPFFRLPPYILIVTSVAQLGGIMSFFGWFVFMRRFARRIPDGKLVRSTSAVMWGLTLTVSAFMVGGLLMGLSAWKGGALGTGAVGAVPASGPTAWPAFGYATTLPAVATAPASARPPPIGPRFVVGGIVMCVGSVAAVVFWIAYVVLLFRYRRAFSQTLEQARALAPPQTHS